MKSIVNIKRCIGVAMILISITSYAQTNPGTDFKNAVGLRAGETSGITFKHFLNNKSAIEGIVSAWPYTLGLTGLYEAYTPIGTKGLNFYAGGGGHLNFGGPRYQYYYVYRNNGYDYVYARGFNGTAIGLDGVIGLEYKFKPIPLAISADLKPYYEISTLHYSYFTLDPSIGIKLTFK